MWDYGSTGTVIDYDGSEVYKRNLHPHKYYVMRFKNYH